VVQPEHARDLPKSIRSVTATSRRWASAPPRPLCSAKKKWTRHAKVAIVNDLRQLDCGQGKTPSEAAFALTQAR